MNQIDNHQIVEKIGEGGMGEVYKGIDVMLEREVAIKLLRPELSSREDVVQRFRSEAVALGRLHHSNIATVYNFGRYNDQYYMALEFVNGDTLDSIIKQKGPLPWRDAVRYAISILEGLSHAHGFNIVHRDIKPSNIIVTDNNHLKILDFGIARILEKARLTRSGHLVGTLEYVSPEQLKGKDTDARADIYSTGVVLYEMLTGHLPFEKNTEYDLIKSHIEEKPKSLRTLSGSIPAVLDKIVLKALEKQPDKRFASAMEFGKELSHTLDLAGEATDPSSVIGKESRFFRFCTDYPMLILLVVFLLGGSGYLVWKIKFSTTEPSVSTPELANLPVSSPVQPSRSDLKLAIESIPAPLNVEEPKQIDDNPLLPSPTDNTPVIPEPPLIRKEEATKPTTTTASSKIDRVKRRSPQTNKYKKPKKTLPSDPNIDDWAKDFFRH